ncbi:MAG: hypothetical protein IPO21_10490 [Bacteroidales bacterium]|nr:hypothetical protein [Bacteroidales bacterium]
MNKLKIGLINLIITFSLTGYAQLNNFDLAKYKLPEMKRKSMETDINAYGENYIYDRKYSIANNQFKDESKYNNLNANLNFDYYSNSAKFQREAYINLYFSGYYDHDKRDSSIDRINSSFTTQQNTHLINRRYITNRLFYETDFYFNYNLYNSQYHQKNFYDSTESNTENNSQTFYGNIPLKIGIGRIEQVQDARHAVYIFKELSRNGSVSPDKTDEQIIEFAQFISQLNNKRFFDSRLKRMKQIESIDSFLRANNYVLNSDAKYFTTLGDIWDFGGRPIRNSGTRLSGVFQPGYYIYDYYSKDLINEYDNYQIKKRSFVLDGGIEFKHEKPLNLYWQNSIDLNCYAGIIKGINEFDHFYNDIKYNIPNLRIGFKHAIGFYPNTRTDLTFNYSLEYIQLFDKTDIQNNIPGIEGKRISASAGLDLNYYISPRFKLNATFSIRDSWSDSNNFDLSYVNMNSTLYDLSTNSYSSNEFIKRNNFQTHYGLSLTYSIF